MHDKSFADEEKHDRDLGDGEEAPDGGLFHQVGGDKGGQYGAEEEEEASLENHTLLLVESEERSKHEEGVDAGAHHEVAGVSHGDGPTQVHHGAGLESAEVLSTEPFGGLVVRDVHHVETRDVGEEVADEEKESSDEAQSLDHNISIAVLFALG